MSAVPPGRIPKNNPPVSAANGQAPPSGGPSISTNVASSAIMLSFLQQQLKEILMQQAAQRAAAAAAGAGSVRAAPPVPLTPDQLKQISAGVGGLSSFLNLAALLASNEENPPQTGKDFTAQMASLAAALKQMMDASKNSSSIPQAGGQPFDQLATQMIAALNKLPPEELGMLMYMVVGNGATNMSADVFRSGLDTLKASNPMWGPLCDTVTQHWADVTPALPSQNATGSMDWSPQYIWKFTESIGFWLGTKTGDGGSPCAFQKDDVAGLFSSLQPWLQWIGQGSTAPANAGANGFEAVTAALAALAMLPNGGNNLMSMWDQFYQTGVGLNSLGSLVNQMLAAQLYKMLLNSGLSKDRMNSEINDLINTTLTKRAGPGGFGDNLADVQRILNGIIAGKISLANLPMDSLAAPLMVLMFGSLPKPKTEEDLIAEAQSMFATDRLNSIKSSTEKYLEITGRGDNDHLPGVDERREEGPRA